MGVAAAESERIVAVPYNFGSAVTLLRFSPSCSYPPGPPGILTRKVVAETENSALLALNAMQKYRPRPKLAEN